MKPAGGFDTGVADRSDVPEPPARGRLIVLAGPSAVGKSSVIRRLRELVPQMYFSVSATTRAPRPGEVDGVDYRFVSSEQFDAMIASRQLLEWAEIHGGLQRSGTPAAPVFSHLEAGRPVLIEVDLNGARAIRVTCREATLVFLEPPSWNDLVSRLTGRGTETPATLQRRLHTAEEEMAARDEFDVVVVNDDVERAARQLVSLLVGVRPDTGSGGPGAVR
ncbi:guanylate kinase [Millisia brevis]|uniref:guanylate kinase n=1 Tax=Millisia brevis TaxID=264148 RepID=UPI0009FBC9C9|nr:guanylate kinase [Millisia brevis]